MSMYDIVWVRCPKCGYEVEFQSKAGRCALDEYYWPKGASLIPPAIAGDLNDEVQWCEVCDRPVAIIATVILQVI